MKQRKLSAFTKISEKRQQLTSSTISLFQFHPCYFSPNRSKTFIANMRQIFHVHWLLSLFFCRTVATNSAGSDPKAAVGRGDGARCVLRLAAARIPLARFESARGERRRLYDLRAQHSYKSHRAEDE